MGTRGGVRKGCTAISIPWAHYYGMDKRTALGSHREVRITRNSMDPAKLRWDQFILSFVPIQMNDKTARKYTITLFLA